jgi:(p)ppGpp synthase/HD superfamily hydrolase
MPRPTNSDAHAFAAAAHAGQRDGAGLPFMRHVNRVAGAAFFRAQHAQERDELAISPQDVIQAAYLHDVLEDTPTTTRDLRRAGFSDVVVDMVNLLTEPEDRSSFAERTAKLTASRNLGALLIKMSDIEDYQRASRALPNTALLRRRYEVASPVLSRAAVALGYTGI